MLRSSLFFQIAQFEFFCFFSDWAFGFINERFSLLKLYKKTCSWVLKALLSIDWPNKRLKRDCQRVAALVQN
ncbi:hypothetical protein CCZ37_17460 [Vibrio qinghaiensis]|uniref:Uncharacterized protein n=1 Tax=Vibrio qinghaiensis TaxID=2025808 RepID=A0A223N3A1_9VIBR|nr:hypothetical protein CCZ37_17460 [Vibrio qinghaiensis]MDF9390582.1 hypothetical protein [Vibrio sp. 1151_11]OXX52868.1 hypothetical protein B9J82_15085 [Vibrio sp. V10_P2A27P122]PSD42350.1 hypothetical protein C7E22_06120 [Vibrio sp. V02_P2A34T13]